jgi:hypothetical protein
VGSLKAALLALHDTITTPSFRCSNAAMVKKALISALLLLLTVGLFACGDREEIQADRVAKQVATDAEDDARCRDQGAPGSPAYDACRQDLAAERAQKAQIDYQKARDFDRVLGGLDDL